MQFIDIHGHYAWNIDDGIPSKDDAYHALSIAKSNNIQAIVATPHIVPGSHNLEDIKTIQLRINELKELASEFQIQVYEGCELFLNHDCIQSIHDNLFIPFENTHYLVVEFDVRKELGDEHEVEDYLYEIEMKGYIPIIAHVERYFKDEIDLDRIRDFIDSGYIIQVNSSSLLGIHGKTVKNNAYRLLNEGLVHVIASDTHRCEGKRIPNLQLTFDTLSKDYSYQTLKTLMFDNPESLLNNKEVVNIEAKKSFFRKLLKRR